MIQLYALMREPLSDALIERFPNAVKLGNYRLGVFVDSELDSITTIAQNWQRFTSEETFNTELAILTYDQAKEISLKYSADEDKTRI